MPRLNKFSLKTLRKDLRKVSGGKSVRRPTQFGGLFTPLPSLNEQNTNALTTKFKQILENDYEKGCTNLRQSYNQKEIDLCNSEKQRIKNDADTYKISNKIKIDGFKNKIDGFNKRIQSDISSGINQAYGGSNQDDKSNKSTILYNEIKDFLNSIDKNINNDNYKLVYLNKEIDDLKRYINNYDVIWYIKQTKNKRLENYYITREDINNFEWLTTDYYKG